MKNQRPTCVEIDLDAIVGNLAAVQRRVSPARVMAVVKANAYGHGLQSIAEATAQAGAEYLGVALAQEGVELREKRIQTPILVLGGFFEDEVKAFLQYDLEATVYDWPRAVALSQRAVALGKRAKVHVKVDTGMGRVGVNWREAVGFVREVQSLRGLELLGIYTHFASSDAADKSFAQRQLRRFREVVTELDRQGVTIPLKHAANSGAVLDLPESYFDMVRVGLLIYGYYPSRETTESVAVSPALRLKSRVIAVKDVPPGTVVSYNSTYRTGSKTRIATVPIGYGDGYNRLLSNRGEVLIRGRRHKVVGAVCMDQIMVDVGGDAEVVPGDEVVLLGRQGGEEITIYEICDKLNTIPYEVTCWISERVPRLYESKSG